MIKKFMLAIGVITIVLASLLLGLVVYDYWNRPQMVANILNISIIPGSLEVAACESPFTTDVLTTCIVKVDPQDFPLLLAGYQFSTRIVNTTSHLAIGHKIGQEFEVATEYMVEPVQFKHGGYVRLLADKSNKNVVVDLYKE